MRRTDFLAGAGLSDFLALGLGSSAYNDKARRQRDGQPGSIASESGRTARPDGGRATRSHSDSPSFACRRWTWTETLSWWISTWTCPRLRHPRLRRHPALPRHLRHHHHRPRNPRRRLRLHRHLPLQRPCRPTFCSPSFCR